MKHTIGPLLAAILLAASTGAAVPAEKLPGPIPAQVTKVRDGDTLEVRVDVEVEVVVWLRQSMWVRQSIETAVRIDGIDTPEERGKCETEKALAAKAGAMVEDMLANSAVTLFDVVDDKYAGRVRARVVTADGRDVAKEMIRSGLAREYSGGTRKSWCTVTVVPKR